MKVCFFLLVLPDLFLRCENREAGHSYRRLNNSPIAQLARALAWHARGHRFDPDILHLSGITHFIVCIISAEIFDILTHKTVVLDIYNNQEHSRKYETSVIRLNRF